MNFKRNLAVVIGINQYTNGINPLQTAVPDAQKLSDILAQVHDYQLIHPDAQTNAAILNTEATLEKLKTLFSDILPNQIRPTSHDRLFIYFAGHGITRQVDDQGPQGFLVPQDADSNNCDTLLPMSELYDALNQLECRHLFVVLDCCFAGMFRWASTRKVVLVPDEIHWEHYHRFIKYPAWQVITSAAHNQEALDYLDNRVTDSAAKHSPFAAALFEGLLDHRADLVPDGVITAAELYLYLRDYVEKHSNEKQTPGFWPLNKHDRGEYIFQLVPEEQLTLKSAPKLEKDNNPYRGLESFDEKHAALFFGREDVIDDLVTHISAPERPFIVVDGISGSGKSSLVKAGLISRLKEQYGSTWHVFSPIRPGTDAYHALASSILPTQTSPQDIQQASEALKTSSETLSILMESWSQLHPGKQLLLVIDQFEELITLAPKPKKEPGRSKWNTISRGRRFEWQPPNHSLESRPQWQVFTERLAQAIESCPQLRVLVTLRSDFAPRFQASALGSMWADARFLVRPMRSDELRQAVIGPANEMALYFEPANLVDTLVDEVAQTPGALPLLSFTLSELYLKLYREWNRDGKEDRALAVGDEFYRQGGVAGLLAKRANDEHDQLPDDAHRRTMRQVLLRMVEIEGSEAVKRRVSKKELLYVDAQENQRVETVLARLDRARLIVGGDEAGEAYIEPAHDYLVRGWDRLQDWIYQEQETLLLQRLLIPATKNWHKTKRDLWNGNSRLTLLKQIRKSRDNWLNQLEMLFVQNSLNRKRLNIGARLGFVGVVAMVGTYFWITNERWAAATGQVVSSLRNNLQKTTQQLNDVSAQNVEYQLQYDETKQNLNLANVRAGQEALAKEAAIARTVAEEEKARVATQLAQDNFKTAQRNAVNQFATTAKLFMRNRKPVNAMVYAISAADISRSESLWEEGSPPSTVPVTLLNVIESNLERNVFTVPTTAISETAVSDDVESDAAESERAPSEGAAPENIVYAAAITADREIIISGDHQGQLLFWRANNPSEEPIQSLTLPDEAEIRDILTTPKEASFIWAENEEGATIARVEKENESFAATKIKRFESEPRPVSVAIASDGQTIAVGTQTKTITMLDDDFNELGSEVLTELDSISSVAISPNGEVVVVAGTKDDTPQVQIWTHKAAEKDSGKTLEKTGYLEKDALKRYTSITAVTISPDGQNIVLLGDEAIGDTHINSRISVWDLAGGKQIYLPMKTASKIHQMAVTKGGNILATVPDPKDALFDRSDVHLWSIEGKRLFDKTVDGDVKDAAITPDGKTIVLSSFTDSKNKLHVWEGSQRQTVAQVAKYYFLSETSDTAAEKTEVEVASAVPATVSPAELPSDPQEKTADADTSASELIEASEQEKTAGDSSPVAENPPATKSSNEEETVTDNGDRAERTADDSDTTDDGSLNTETSDSVISDEDSSNESVSDENSPDEDSSNEENSDESVSSEVTANDISPENVKTETEDTDEVSADEVNTDEVNTDEVSTRIANAERASSVESDGDESDGDEVDSSGPAEEAQVNVSDESNDPNDNAIQLALQQLSANDAQTLIALSPSGKTVAIGENAVVNGKKDYRFRVQKASSTELLSEEVSLLDEGFQSLPGEIHSLSISEAENNENPQRVAITLKTNKQNSYYVKVFDMKTGRFLANPLNLNGSQVLVQISPDGRALVSATTQKQDNGKYASEVKLWKIASPDRSSSEESEPTATLTKASTPTVGEISALAISTDGNSLMTAHNEAFDDMVSGHKFGGKGALTIWDISSQESGERNMSKKKTIAAGGYISAIALSSAQQKVALITQHAEHLKPATGRGKREEIVAKQITSEVRTWTWEGRPTSQTLSLGKGRLMKFVGLMPDGENIVVAGHEVIPLADRSDGLNSPRPIIQIFNKQSVQLFDLDWAAALGTNGEKSTDETQNTVDNSVETLAYQVGNPEKLTALVVADDGKHMFSAIQQPNQRGIIRWNLEIENLLQASCEQIKHHSILYRPPAELQDISKEARHACSRFSGPGSTMGLGKSDL